MLARMVVSRGLTIFTACLVSTASLLSLRESRSSALDARRIEQGAFGELNRFSICLFFFSYCFGSYGFVFSEFNSLKRSFIVLVEKNRVGNRPFNIYTPTNLRIEH